MQDCSLAPDWRGAAQRLFEMHLFEGVLRKHHRCAKEGVAFPLIYSE